MCTNHTLSSIWPDGSGFSCCSRVRIANFPPPEKRFSRQTHSDRWKFHHDYKFDTSLAGGFNFFYFYPSLRRIISNLMAIIFNIPQQKGYTSVYFEKKQRIRLIFFPGGGCATRRVSWHLMLVVFLSSFHWQDGALRYDSELEKASSHQQVVVPLGWSWWTMWAINKPVVCWVYVGGWKKLRSYVGIIS